MTGDLFSRLARWDRDRELIRQIRQTVFVIEQQVDPDLEWDGGDADAIHALAGPSDDRIVATGRLQKDGRIGRMAVLPAWRRQGLGAAIMNELVRAATQSGLNDVYLHAQTHALDFYRRHGFVVEGPEFDEADIPHRLMRRTLRGTEMNEPQTRQLSTPGDYAQAVIDLINDARLAVDVFSPDLTPVVFGSTELIAAVRDFAFRSHHGKMRVLVRDSGPLTRDDHRFLGLVQRISSKVSVRVLAADYHSRDDAFVIADGKKYVQRRQASVWAGIYDLNRPEVARQLETAYNGMWEHSLPDSGVRRLHI